MLVIRSALFNLCFFIWTPVCSVLLIAFRPFGFGASWFWARVWSRTTLGLARLICGIRFEIEGAEHLPDAPCVVMAKHQSAMETIAMPLLVPPYVWVLKRELFFIPIFGWALRVINAIAIRRSQPREALKQVVQQGAGFIQDGRWVVIFPEGTRTASGETGNYQASGIMLADKAHAGILPMAHNAGQCWPKNGFIKHPGTVTFRFLPFIDADAVKAAKRNELLEQLKTDIEANVRGLESGQD